MEPVHLQTRAHMKNVTANVKVRQFSFVHYGNLSDGCLLVIVVVTLIYNFILLLHFSSYSTVEVFPLQMEGVRVVVNKGLSNNFQVTHTVTLSMMGESGYRFGTSYVGRKQISPTEVFIMLNHWNFQHFRRRVLLKYVCFCILQYFPVMVGDMDNTGSLNAQVIHQLTSAVRSKIAIQVKDTPSFWQFGPMVILSLYLCSVLQTQQHKFVNWQCDMEYRGADFTTAVTLGNPDVLVGSGMIKEKTWNA